MIYWAHEPDPICVLSPAPNDRLTLTITATPLASLSLAADGAAVFQGSIPANGVLTLPWSPRAESSQLIATVTQRSSSLRQTMRVSRRQIFPIGGSIREQIEKGHPPADWPAQVQRAQRRLDAGEPALSPPERAYFLGQLGNVLQDYLSERSSEELDPQVRAQAIALFQRAIQEAQAQRLYSVEAASLTRLFDFMFLDQERSNLLDLISILRDSKHNIALQTNPFEGMINDYNLSWLNELVGNLAQAARDIDRALAQAQRVRVPSGAMMSLHIQRAVMMQYLNNEKESLVSEKATTKILESASDLGPCEILQTYNSLAWIHILQMQNGRHDSLARDYLEKSYRHYPACREQNKTASIFDTSLVLLNLARVAMLEAEPATAATRREDLLSEAEQHIKDAVALGSQRPEVTVDLLELRGRLALLRGDGPAAQVAFRELETLTATRILTPYYQWAALIGQADAHAAQGSRAEAIAAYRRAERLLQRIAAGLPLTSRRQMFVAQFEAGTARYLSLLADSDPKAALAAIRSARTRALHAFVQSAGGSSEDPTLRAHMQRYYQLYADRDLAVREHRDVPLDEQEAAARKLHQIDAALQDVLKDLYLGPATESAPESEPGSAYRAPRADELILSCFPLPKRAAEPVRDWLCAAADAHGHYLSRQRLTRWTPEQAAAVLTAFAAPLRRAKHLHLLPYDGMRDIVWETLPFDGRSLSERLTVTYGLDLPRPTATTDASGQTSPRPVLAVLNPEEDLPGAQPAAGWLRRELARQGRKLVLFYGSPRAGGHLWSLLLERFSAREQPALAPAVLRELPTTDLFVYYGHAEPSEQSGWDSHLRFADGGRIAARDVMALSATPRRVLLFGCDTAVSDRQAPADELGLAQAFLLRGSREVLATTRRVPAKQAAELLHELIQRGALTAAVPLAESLRQALSALRQRGPHPDWDAFRVFQP